MKFMILIFSIVISVYGAAVPFINEIAEECRVEMLEKLGKGNACVLPIMGKLNLLSKFNETTTSLIDDFLNLHCSEITIAMQCLVEAENISPSCLRGFEAKSHVRRIITNTTAQFVSQACDDNGEMIKKLIPYDGLLMFFVNSEFNRCWPDMYAIRNVNDLCNALDVTKICAENVLCDHPNSDIILVTQTVVSALRTNSQCEEFAYK